MCSLTVHALGSPNITFFCSRQSTFMALNAVKVLAYFWRLFSQEFSAIPRLQNRRDDIHGAKLSSGALVEPLFKLSIIISTILFRGLIIHWCLPFDKTKRNHQEVIHHRLFQHKQEHKSLVVACWYCYIIYVSKKDRLSKVKKKTIINTKARTNNNAGVYVICGISRVPKLWSTAEFVWWWWWK